MLTHLDSEGHARMVSVASKPVSVRVARAEAVITLNEAAWRALTEGPHPKGDVLATARIAGISAAKQTPALIPLCHNVHLTCVSVDLSLDQAGRRILIGSTAEATDRTGVEMEAMVAASTAALTIYDMLKAADRTMTITLRLTHKSGGKSGEFNRETP